MSPPPPLSPSPSPAAAAAAPWYSGWGHLLSTQHCAAEIQFIDGVLLLASSSGCLQNLPHISVCERMDLILNELDFEHKCGKLEFLLTIMKSKTSTVGKV